MQRFEYKVVPAPTKGVKGKGVKGPEGRFAHGVEGVMNALAAEGWEYLRSDTLNSEERSGLTSKVSVWRTVLVFRRAVELEPAPEGTPLLETAEAVAERGGVEVAAPVAAPVVAAVVVAGTAPEEADAGEAVKVEEDAGQADVVQEDVVQEESEPEEVTEPPQEEPAVEAGEEGPAEAEKPDARPAPAAAPATAAQEAPATPEISEADDQALKDALRTGLEPEEAATAVMEDNGVEETSNVLDGLQDALKARAEKLKTES